MSDKDISSEGKSDRKGIDLAWQLPNLRWALIEGITQYEMQCMVNKLRKNRIYYRVRQGFVVYEAIYDGLVQEALVKPDNAISVKESEEEEEKT